MKFHEAIHKAIEGGYAKHTQPYKGDFNMQAIILLDPEFWKALGKSMGWDKKLHKDFRLYSEVLPNWQYYWLGLIIHLAEGNSIESYFETL